MKNVKLENFIIFFTLSGSSYEVDQENNRIRRLAGTKDPTVRQGNDGEWKDYKHLSFSEDGVLIVWNIDDHGISKTTMTSPVVKVVNKSAMQ
jgi:hypothetical protein